MLADQPIGRNLDFAAALASHVDDLAAAEVVESGICAIDEAAGHHRLRRVGMTWTVTRSANLRCESWTQRNSQSNTMAILMFGSSRRQFCI